MITRRRILSTGMGLTAMAASGVYLLSVRPAAAQSGFDYYISPTGSEANPGTPSQPWSLRALDQSVARSYGRNLDGKRIGALDGTYRCGEMAKTGASNIVLPWNNFALEAVNQRQAVFTTENNNGSWAAWDWPGGILYCGGSNQTIRGIRFYRVSHVALWVAGTTILVQDCKFENFLIRTDRGNNPGVIRTGSFGRGLTIRNCLFDNIRLAPEYDGNITEAVGPVYDYTNIVIEYSTFLNTTAALFPKRNAGNYTVRYCFMKNDASMTWGGGLKYCNYSDHQRLADFGQGAFADYGRTRNYFHNNIMSYAGFWSQGPQTGQWENACDFYNNTIVYPKRLGGGEAFGHQDVGATDSNGVAQPRPGEGGERYWNNILVATSDIAASSGWLRLSADATPIHLRSTLWDFNGYSQCVFDQKSTGHEAWCRNIAEWRRFGASKGVSLDANGVESSNHGFVNINGATPADFRLTAGSAFKGAGRDGGTVAGAVTDMGAWGSGAARIGADFGARPEPPVVTVG